MYYIGIDGGGTKSRLIATDHKLNILGRYTGAETNICALPSGSVAQNIKSLIGQFLAEQQKKITQCLGVGIGSAGMDNQENIQIMEEMIRAVGFTCPVKVVNDAELMLWSEIPDRPGIVMISGTGSVAYGKSASQKVIRCGGWGHLIDDEGSGYWIGRELLSRAFKAWDGRSEKTVLNQYLLEHFEITEMDQLLSEIYSQTTGKKEIAALNKLVIRAAEYGDGVAGEILTEAAQGLFRMFCALYQQLETERLTLVLYGGNLIHNEYLRKALFQMITAQYPLVEIRDARVDAAMGAVYLAAGKNG